MRTLAIIAAILVAPHLAGADPTAKSTEPSHAVCKRVIVGRGLERHVVCVLTTPLIVKVDPPRPNVLIVPHDGRAIVGRPRSEDRLAGLSHQLN